MEIKEAIQKAIEGGWKSDHQIDRVQTHEGTTLISLWSGSGKYPDIAPEEICLDPLFWQALGKSMGWEEDPDFIGGHKDYVDKWCGLVRHLAEGGTIEEWFHKL